ncbi:MAG: hypothetical protein K2X86_03455 [Cytophagaceae bacterium]|nr:hypothetical protein [Cytophagaceae bacterium]
MKRAMNIKFKALKNRIASEAEDILQSIYKNTDGLAKDISKEVSKIDLDSIYKAAQKNIQSAAKDGSRVCRKSLRRFKKSDLYKGLNREVPKLLTLIAGWSTLQLRKAENISTQLYGQTRKWVVKQYPKVENWVSDATSDIREWVSDNYPKMRSFAKENYPKIENFILNQVPLYRMVFAKMA